MLGNHFYNQIVRKNIIAFGTLFNNITMKSTDPSTGAVLEEMKVPLAYGPKQKFIVRLEENTSNRKVAITLPRLYFEMTSIDYDPTRKTSPIQKYKTIINDNGGEVRVQYVPVPYNLSFELGVIAKSQDDALQITEQILPYFQPSFSVTLNMIPDMNEKRDIAVVLNNVSYEDTWDDSFYERRYIVYTLNFQMKTYLYGPYNTSDVIKKAIIHETLGDRAVNRRAITRTYTPKAKTDINTDGVIAKSQDDALQISEQILPYFQPSFSMTLNLIPDMDEKRDIAIVLNNVSYEDTWDDSFYERRYIVYTLQFTVKTYLYGPYNTADVIKKAIIHETIGDKAVNRRTITRTYTPVAKTDINQDGNIDAADTALLDAGDDFGFNEGIEFL